MAAKKKEEFVGWAAFVKGRLYVNRFAGPRVNVCLRKRDAMERSSDVRKVRITIEDSR